MKKERKDTFWAFPDDVYRYTVKWVQPKCFRRPKLYFFYLSPLGLQHTELFKNKSEEPAAFFF